MMTLNPPLPAVPTDNALTYALTLIGVEQAVANAATAVDVSAAANVARSKSLDDREAQLAARIAAHEAKERALAAKAEQWRAALA